MSIDAFLAVPGHLYDSEGRHLQDLAKGKKVLEIGTHLGRSAVAMAATAFHVTTIDHYRGDAQIGAPSLEEAMGNIRSSGLAGSITQVVADWTKWIAGPVDLQAYDMLFYDAGHTPKNAYEKDFLALCEDFQGIIALHDYKPNEEGMKYVVQATDDFARKTNRPGLLMSAGSIVWFEAV